MTHSASAQGQRNPTAPQGQTFLHLNAQSPACQATSHRQTGQGGVLRPPCQSLHTYTGSRGPPGTQPKAEPYRSLFRAILGVQVGVLHGLHLWTPQEVVQCVESVRGPGDRLGRLTGLTRRAGAWTQRMAPCMWCMGAETRSPGGEEGRRGREKRKKSESPGHILPRILAG